MLEKGSIEADIFGLSSLSYIFFASVHPGEELVMLEKGSIEA